MVIGSRSLERLKLAKEADKSSRGLILPSSPKPPPPPSRAASGERQRQAEEKVITLAIIICSTRLDPFRFGFGFGSALDSAAAAISYLDLASCLSR